MGFSGFLIPMVPIKSAGKSKFAVANPPGDEGESDELVSVTVDLPKSTLVKIKSEGKLAERKVGPQIRYVLKEWAEGK